MCLMRRLARRALSPETLARMSDDATRSCPLILAHRTSQPRALAQVRRLHKQGRNASYRRKDSIMIRTSKHRGGWVFALMAMGLGIGCASEFQDADGASSWGELSEGLSLASRETTSVQVFDDSLTLEVPDGLVCGGKLGNTCGGDQ